MKPYTVYWRYVKGRDHYRVIICDDDTIPNGIRYYEGYHFKPRGKGNYKRIFLISEATTTPNSRRYSMKNWVRVSLDEISGLDKYMVEVMIDGAKYRYQPYTKNGEVCIVSERKKILNDYWVCGCFDRKRMPPIGMVNNGHFEIIHRTIKDGKDYYKP